MGRPSLKVLAAVAALTPACGPDSGDAESAFNGPEGGWPSAVEADRSNYSTVRDNDVVRILEADYGAGETSAMHAHPEYCFVFLDDATWAVIGADGTSGELQVNAGDFDCASAGAHQPTNASARRARVVVIELKEGAVAGTSPIDGADAVVADPAHYRPLVETESVRISRVSYPAGSSGVDHAHPAFCVIWLSDPPGAPEIGHIDCRLARGHPARVYEEGVDLIMVEFTGRAVG